MSSLPTFYLTTAIYYANATPHIGHAYEIIAADVIARFQRLQGKNVFFLTGTDEHGIKVQKTAESAGTTPQAYVDGIAEGFKQAWQELNITQTRFIRTTEKDHYDLVAKIWQRLETKGDIYKAKYTGEYCRGCELFLTERDKDEAGNCLIHGTQPEKIEEENYFFKLTKYKDQIQQLLSSNADFILPQSRLPELLNQLEDVHDISVSRAAGSVSWGIPVPNDPEQVIYVWIDALSNYLTGVDWHTNSAEYQTFWPPNVQIIGKDIMRFHAIYWVAMLLAAELPLPKSLLVHGFIRLSDSKLSKSTGNILTVKDMMERFELPNVDPIRYYLMASTGFGQDGNYTDDEFKLKVNADLANNLGNLLNRTVSMSAKYCDGKVPSCQQLPDRLALSDELEAIKTDFEQYSFNEALAKIIILIDKGNKAVNDGAPWALHKEEKFEAVNQLLYQVLELVRQAAIILLPVTPTLSQQIWQQLGYSSDINDSRWADLTGQQLPQGQLLCPSGAILPRLDSDIVGAGKKG